MYEVNLTESFFPAQADTQLEPLSLGDMLRRGAAKWPDAPALREITLSGDVGRIWTYQELLDDSLKLGAVLGGRHKKGARVAVWAPNVPEWILLEFGLAFAGVILVTVNPSLQHRELEYVLTQSGAEGLYYVDAFRGNPMGKIAEEVCASLPQIKHLVDISDHDALFEGEAGELPEVTATDPAQIQYTSGTTGFPKGAILHHGGLVQNGRDTVARLNFKPGEKSLNFMPLFHTTGCAVHVLGVLGSGGNMALQPMFDPMVSAKVIEREKIELMVGVPTMLVALIEVAKKTPIDYSAVRCVGSGGSMVSPELARAAQVFFGAKIQIVYGQTEASPVLTTVWPDDSFEDATETIGQALPHIDLAIKSTETGAVLPVGEQGEIRARGYNVMHGYNDNPQATAAAIDEEGWLHTGDLGVMDARGFVKITGRVKEMIIRGGENLFPVEIENEMLEHPDLAEVAVVGVADPKWGEQVACFMRAAGAARPSAEELKDFIRERLSPQKTPVYWIYVDAFPLTGSGKIQKLKLAQDFADDKFDVLAV
ncbi:MAG: AMP-binding protein [Pseudomonadota bacterium]